MATFGEMLAAAQAITAPASEGIKAESEAKQADIQVREAKRKQIEELQNLMEELMEEASKKRDKGFGGWIKERFDKLGLEGGEKILDIFFPGLGALRQAEKGYLEAEAQKEGLKSISKDPRLTTYSGTYLGAPTKGYLKDVESLSEQINPLMSGLLQGGVGYGLSKLGQRAGKSIKGIKVDIPFGYREKAASFKDFLGAVFQPGPRGPHPVKGMKFFEKAGVRLRGIPEGLKATREALPQILESLGGELSDIPKEVLLGKGGTWKGLKNKGLMENLERFGPLVAILPGLIKQMSGEEELDFDPERYFQ